MTPKDHFEPPHWVVRKALKAAGIILHFGVRFIAGLRGVKPRHLARDRRLLDEVILPRLAQNDRFARVLFVGCDWDTAHVEGRFVSKGRDYITIEIPCARAVRSEPAHRGRPFGPRAAL